MTMWIRMQRSLSLTTLVVTGGMASFGARAETWSQPVSLLLVEPLASWQGGW